eukprot:PhM_4_TR9125/c0_g1_i1/m.87083
MQFLHGLRPFGATSKWLLLYSPAFESIAKAFAEKTGHLVELGSIQWGVFPDGTPNIHLNAAQIEGRDVLFFGSAQENLLSFFGAVYAIPRYNARTFVVVMPFFPTGTMERVAVEGDVATAKTLARMMSVTPAPCVGMTTYVIYDMHALATRFFFSDTINVRFVTATPLMLRRLQELEAREGARPAVAFPDEGAKKRFLSLFPGYDAVLCVKTRVGMGRQLTLQEGDPVGRHCIIIDDLVQTGGTLLSCHELLYARGARAVSVFVTHGVFPNNSWERFLTSTLESQGKRPFDKFYLTDSIPTTAEAVRGKEPFCVLSICASLGSLLQQPELAKL